MKSRTFNSKRNLIYGIISSLLVPILGFLVKTVLNRCFNIDYIGLTSLFNSVIEVLNLAELGFSSAVVVYLYRPIHENNDGEVCRILSYYRKVYLCIGAIITAVGILFLPFIKNLIGSPERINENIVYIYLIYIANTSVSYFLFAYKEALLNALQRFDITKKIYLSVNIFKCCGQIIAIYYCNNFYLYVIILFLSTIVYNLSIEYISEVYYQQYVPVGVINHEIRNKIRKQVAGVAIGKLLDVTRNSLDTLVLTAFLGLDVAGIFNNYLFVFSTIIGIMWVITSAIQGSVGNSIVSETKEKNRNDLFKMEFLYNFIITSATTVLCISYQPFMILWMGEELLLGDYEVGLFISYFYVMAINGVRNAYFYALGFWWKAKWYVILESFTNLIFNIIFGRIYGVIGILATTVFTIIVFNYICITNLIFRDYFKKGLFIYYRNRVLNVIFTIIICQISLYISSIISFGGIMGIMINTSICIILSGLLLLALTYYFQRNMYQESIELAKRIIRI